MKKKTRFFCLSLLFASICFQNVQFVRFGPAAIKPYHVLTLALVPYLFRGKIKLFPNSLAFFLVLILVVSLVVSPIFGIHAMLLNYLFAFLLLLIVGTVGADFTSWEWSALIQKVALWIMAIIWVKNLLQIQQFVAFFRHPFGHPVVTTFFGGGVNLEATYMAMLIPFFRGDRRMWLYHAGSMALSLAYVSRTALIINALVLLWLGISYIDRKHWGRVIAGVAVIAGGIVYLYSRGSLNYMISRLTDIGRDLGSVGRMRMWEHFFEGVSRYPFGVGIGNGIAAIQSISGIQYTESNLHNLYMQMFLDLGVIGGLYYVGLVLGFVCRSRHRFFSNAAAFSLLLYIVASFVQFRGAEALVYFVLAVYWKTEKQTNGKRGILE